MLFVGDWNISFNPELDNRSYLPVNNPNARVIIKNRMMTDGLMDVWRLNSPLQKDYSWFQGGSERRARLDYFLTSFNVPDITVGVGI